MLPTGTREILIWTLTEMQSRLEYLACSVIEGDDPESAAELRSSAGSIERVIERLRSMNDAGEIMHANVRAQRRRRAKATWVGAGS